MQGYIKILIPATLTFIIASIVYVALAPWGVQPPMQISDGLLDETSRYQFPDNMYAIREECEHDSERECGYLSCENITSPLASYKENLKEICRRGISGIWMRPAPVDYSDVSSWNIYTNTRYGYRIKYPVDFGLMINGSVYNRLENIIPYPELGERVSLDISKYQRYGNNLSPAYTMSVRISADANSDRLDLREWYFEYARSNSFYDGADLSNMITKGLVVLSDGVFKNHRSLEVRNINDSGYGGYDLYISQKDVVLHVRFSYQEIIKENITSDIDPERVFGLIRDSLEFLEQQDGI